MSVIDDIKARLDIVDVVSSYVPLQKAGRSFKAPCPFHNEKTPSFIVNPERQSWHCFGACSTGGDAFKFVMRKENMEFPEALQFLANKVGIELPTRGERAEEQHASLYKINQLTAQFYRESLSTPEGKSALDYLERRGVDEPTRQRFGLGYSPQGWDGLKSHLLSLGVDENAAVEAGVLSRGDNGRTFDFFRGRVMFPIHDTKGQVIGFGARALGDSNPKYLNTGQTPIFNKRSTLYALHLARESIREQKTGVVVEGYMDVIAAHQFGYRNVVASMGTALTEQQVNLLKPLAKTFVYALDSDAAGQEATQRALITTWEQFFHQRVNERRSSLDFYFREAINLRVLLLSSGKDPDELIRSGPEQWDTLVGKAMPFMEYIIPAVVSRIDTSTGPGKTQAVEFLFPFIMSQDPFDQEHYLRVLAEKLDVDQGTLRSSIASIAQSQTRRGRDQRRGSERQPEPQNAGAAFLKRSENALDDYVLALLLQKPDAGEAARDFDAKYFTKIEARELFTLWLGCSKIDDLWNAVDESLRDYLASLSQRKLATLDLRESERALAQCMQRMETKYLQELQENLLTMDGADSVPSRSLEDQIAGVNARIKELFAQRN